MNIDHRILSIKCHANAGGETTFENEVSDRAGGEGRRPILVGTPLQAFHSSRPYILEKDLETVIVNPFGSECAVYLARANSGILVSLNLRSLVSKIDATLSRDTIRNQLVTSDLYDSRTIWDGISILTAGREVKVNLRTSNVKFFDLDFRKIPHYSDNCIDLLARDIEATCANNGKIAIHLSGGLDSTCLLLAASSVLPKENIVAVTWYDEYGSSHNDKKFAAALTDRLGIQHIISKVREDDIFSVGDDDLLWPDMTTAAAFHGYLARESRELERDHGVKIILNGHGGDHLFFDPVDQRGLIDAVKVGGFKLFTRKLIEFSRLYSLDMFQSVRTLKQCLIAGGSSSTNIEVAYGDGIMEDGRLYSKGMPGKTRHLGMIREAIYQNSSLAIPATSNVVMLHPFTMPRMLGMVANTNVFDLFSGHATRIPMRRAISEFLPDGFTLRNDKGHLTGVYQRALRNKREKIINLLVDGRLAQAKLIDSKSVIHNINLAASGIGGINEFLTKIIPFEMMADIFNFNFQEN